jgi:hypothetical protein
VVVVTCNFESVEALVKPNRCTRFLSVCGKQVLYATRVYSTQSLHGLVLAVVLVWHQSLLCVGLVCALTCYHAAVPFPLPSEGLGKVCSHVYPPFVILFVPCK